MTSIVISQPMFFPWSGFFEQISLADIFIHYDDVQYSKGSFTNRVQLKTERGTEWMTIPLSGFSLGQMIMNTCAKSDVDWRNRHLQSFSRHYAEAIHHEDAHRLIENCYECNTDNLCDISINSTELIATYFDLYANRQWFRSSQLNVPGNSSERVLSICQHFGCDQYITGHGARNYLDHELLDRNGIEVRYMNYSLSPYPQLHGDFTPYVSTLDLIANHGVYGNRFIMPQTIYWKDFINERN